MNRRSPASIGNPAPTGATCAYTGATGYRTSIRSWLTRSVLRNWLLSLILMRLIREYPLVCAFDKQHCNRAHQARLDGPNREWTAGSAVVSESTAQLAKRLPRSFIERGSDPDPAAAGFRARHFSCPPSDKTNGAGKTIKRRDLAARGVRYPRRLRKSGPRSGSRVTEA